MPTTTEHVWLPTPLGDLALHVTQPVGAEELRGACLLLPPVGYPYWSAYRTVRELAEELAGCGVATVRLDYHGTGNSAGTGWEPHRLAAWEESVGFCLQALRASTDLPVGVLGVQVGATLALRVPGELAFTVLWEPVVSGRAFVRSVRLLGQAAPEDGEFAGAVTHAGFPFPRELLADLKPLSMTLLDEAGPVLAVLGPGTEAFAQEVTAKRGVTVQAPTPSPLEQAAEDVLTPTTTVAEVAAWVDGVLGDPRGATEHLQVRGTATTRLTPTGSTQDVVTVSEFGLVGVRTSPAGGSDTVTVFLNSGSEMNAGSGRAWVDYATYLDQAGLATLRLDWSGWGESPDAGHAPGRPYDEHVVEETTAVVHELQRTGQRPVLLGLCAGAWAALEVARTAPVAGVVAVNPQMYWRRGDPVEALMTTTIERRTPDRAREARGARTGWWTVLDLVGARNRAGRWLDALVTRRIPVLLVFAEHDEGLTYLRTRLGRRLRSVLRSGRIQVVEVPGIDHSMHRTWQRAPLRQAMLDAVNAIERS